MENFPDPNLLTDDGKNYLRLAGLFLVQLRKKVLNGSLSEASFQLEKQRLIDNSQTFEIYEQNTINAWFQTIGESGFDLLLTAKQTLEDLGDAVKEQIANAEATVENVAKNAKEAVVGVASAVTGAAGQVVDNAVKTTVYGGVLLLLGLIVIGWIYFKLVK